MTLDRLGRPLRDLRISVTDRCNFRCVYCMPKEVFGRDYRFLDRAELLTFEELADAGLRRVTVSLDSLDNETFRAMNDVDFPVDRVLEGIDSAAAAGLPV